MSLRAHKSLAVVFGLVAAVCVALGAWQLRRLQERRAANTVTAANRARPVVNLEADRRATALLADQRVTALGRYDYARAIVVRGQVYQGIPGVHVVTPLVLLGTDTAVLVNRGFVPAPDAVTAAPIDSLREPDIVQVEGIALPIATQDGKPITHRGRTSWARLDLRALQDSLPYPILGIYIRRIPDSASDATFPRALPVPPLDDGPHLSYAFQWFSFAVVAIVFAGIMWRKRA